MKQAVEFIAAITALIVAIAALTPLIKLIITRRKKRGIIKGLIQLQKTHESLEAIKRDCNADRAIIFSGHNSGGVPRIGSPFYVTALHWAASDAISKNAISNYKSLLVDAHYISMLLEAEDKGYYRFITEEERECQLRDYYLMEGVCESLLFFLKITEGSFLYASISKKKRQFTQDEITMINLQISNIKNNI